MYSLKPLRAYTCQRSRNLTFSKLVRPIKPVRITGKADCKREFLMLLRSLSMWISFISARKSAHYSSFVASLNNSGLENGQLASKTTKYTARTETERIEIMVKVAHSAAKAIWKNKTVIDRIQDSSFSERPKFLKERDKTSFQVNSWKSTH